MLSQATIIGRNHRLMQQNGQDGAFTGRSQSPACYFGLVLDGCGSKYRHHGQLYPSHNEVGARLLGQFAAGRLSQQLGQAPLSQTLTQLQADCGAYLAQLTDLTLGPDCQANRQCFTYTHLLTTLVGFALTPSEGAFFWAGDGYVGLNGEMTRLESHNRPDYLAYGLSPDWQSRWFDPAGVEWLVVASDGWNNDLLTQLASPRSSLVLQRWLNLQARQPTYFEDDGAVAIFWQDTLAL